MLDDQLINELAWQSYRDCHTESAQQKLIENFGPDVFKRKGVEYHGTIVRHVFRLLDEKGYCVAKSAAAPVEEDFSDIC